MTSIKINHDAMRDFVFSQSEDMKKAMNNIAREIMEEASERKDDNFRYVGFVGKPRKKKGSESYELPIKLSPASSKVQDIVTLQELLMANYIKHGVDPNKAAQCTSYTIWAYLGGGDIALEGGDSQ